MTLDLLALSMKSLTFAGVVLAATGMNLPSARPGRFAALAAGGVLLMVANAWLAASPAAVLVDAAYAAWCAHALLRALRPAPVRHEVVGAA